MTSDGRPPRPVVVSLVALAGLAVVAVTVALWPGGPAPPHDPRAPGADDGVPSTADPQRGVVAAPRPADPILDAGPDMTLDAAPDAEPPIAAVRLDELQASVRRFYDGLPEGWRMPEKIRVDEVLPPDAIDILGVPPESILDELSHYPLNMRTGLEIVLEMGPEADSVGVAVILPSGRRYLDVLAIVPPPTAPAP